MAKMEKSTGIRYAGFWIRFLAMLLDFVIIGIPAFLLQMLIVFATGVNSIVYLVEIGVIVLTIYWNSAKGGTPGKWIVKIRIVDAHGKFISIPTSILRYIGYILSGLILGIGFLMIAFTEKKQGLHDKIAKTFVVYR